MRNFISDPQSCFKPSGIRLNQPYMSYTPELCLSPQSQPILSSEQSLLLVSKSEKNQNRPQQESLMAHNQQIRGQHQIGGKGGTNFRLKLEERLDNAWKQLQMLEHEYDYETKCQVQLESQKQPDTKIQKYELLLLSMQNKQEIDEDIDTLSKEKKQLQHRQRLLILQSQNCEATVQYVAECIELEQGRNKGLTWQLKQIEKKLDASTSKPMSLGREIVNRLEQACLQSIKPDQDLNYQSRKRELLDQRKRTLRNIQADLSSLALTLYYQQIQESGFEARNSASLESLSISLAQTQRYLKQSNLQNAERNYTIQKLWESIRKEEDNTENLLCQRYRLAGYCQRNVQQISKSSESSKAKVFHIQQTSESLYKILAKIQKIKQEYQQNLSLKEEERDKASALLEKYRRNFDSNKLLLQRLPLQIWQKNLRLDLLLKERYSLAGQDSELDSLNKKSLEDQTNLSAALEKGMQLLQERVRSIRDTCDRIRLLNSTGCAQVQSLINRSGQLLSTIETSNLQYLGLEKNIREMAARQSERTKALQQLEVAKNHLLSKQNQLRSQYVSQSQSRSQMKLQKITMSNLKEKASETLNTQTQAIQCHQIENRTVKSNLESTLFRLQQQKQLHQDLQKQLKEIEKELNQKEDIIQKDKSLKSQVAEKQKEVECQKDRIARLSQELACLTESLAVQNTVVLQARQGMLSTRMERDSLHAELVALMEKHSDAESQKQFLESRLGNNFSGNRANIEAEVFRSNKLNKALSMNIASVKTKMGESQQQLQLAQLQVSSLRETLIKQRNKYFEEEQANLKAEERLRKHTEKLSEELRQHKSNHELEKHKLEGMIKTNRELSKKQQDLLEAKHYQLVKMKKDLQLRSKQSLQRLRRQMGVLENQKKKDQEQLAALNKIINTLQQQNSGLKANLRSAKSPKKPLELR